MWCARSRLKTVLRLVDAMHCTPLIPIPTTGVVFELGESIGTNPEDMLFDSERINHTFSNSLEETFAFLN